jgi:hypothetical protein
LAFLFASVGFMNGIVIQVDNPSIQRVTESNILSAMFLAVIEMKEISLASKILTSCPNARPLNLYKLVAPRCH